MTPDSKTPVTPPSNDEPEITQEESIPSDGKDEKGEKMMEDLGRERGRDADPSSGAASR
jgi:hypothetical protein